MPRASAGLPADRQRETHRSSSLSDGLTTGARGLFTVGGVRCRECSGIAIASDEPFSGWTKTFTDPRLCAAVVDRLTLAGQIIETGTTS
jgi:hypothetical protein